MCVCVCVDGGGGGERGERKGNIHSYINIYTLYIFTRFANAEF